MSGPTAIDVWSVSALTAHVAALLRGDPVLGECVVRGELSNYRVYSSGHHYFTLKDAGSELRCVMFKGDAFRLRFKPTDGLAVFARGRVDVYEKRGEYQLYCQELVHDGLGTLYEAFDRLRRQLESEGLFAPERKRPLPAYPRRVAVITSPDGAAVRDLVRVLRQRWPVGRILLVEAVVQGDLAAPSLCRALDRVNRTDGIDVVIMGRGGGSLEDLWAFNEECVARAVAACRYPVVSAVGHETDYTICDFVADLRAATPSHAAELVVPDLQAVSRHLAGVERRMFVSLARAYEHAKLRLEVLAGRRVLTAPEALLEQRAQLLDEQAARLERAMARGCETAAQRLAGLSQTLGALDPTAVLQRGYAILRREDGRVVTEPADLPPGTAATAQVAGGTLAVRAE